MNNKIEQLIFDSEINIPFSYAVGTTASRFFVALRDSKKILGKRCKKCDRVTCPPRNICSSCFIETGEWIELLGGGRLLSFTILYRQFVHLPYPTPIVFGIIKLDGADNNFVHLIGGVDLDKIKLGMRLKPVFSENRKGGILDISYFKPE